MRRRFGVVETPQICLFESTALTTAHDLSRHVVTYRDIPRHPATKRYAFAGVTKSAVRQCIQAGELSPIARNFTSMSKAQPAPPAARRWATMQGGADYMNVTVRTIREWITAGKIRGYRINARVIRVDLNEIDAAFEPFGGSAA